MYACDHAPLSVIRVLLQYTSIYQFVQVSCPLSGVKMGGVRVSESGSVYIKFDITWFIDHEFTSSIAI